MAAPEPPIAGRADLPSALASASSWELAAPGGDRDSSGLAEPCGERLLRSKYPPAADRGGGGADPHVLAEQVMLGYHTAKVYHDWMSWQNHTSWTLYSSLSPAQRSPLRVLLVTYVTNDWHSQDRWRFNTQLLLRNNARDVFNFAFFHFDGEASAFALQEWYRDPRVVRRVVGPGCKAHFWSQLDADLADDYDYVWLVDGDLSLAFFSWDVYRSVLKKLRPLVSQPSVIPKAPKSRSTDRSWLHFRAAFPDASFEVAREVHASEIMAPMLDSRIWPSFKERLKGADLTTAWYLDVWWDLEARAHARWCGGPGIVVVNGSPVRHMNTRTMDTASVQKASHCARNGDVNGDNNRAVEAPERGMMKQELCEAAGRMLDREFDNKTGIWDIGKRLAPTFLRYYTQDTLTAIHQ